MSAPAPSPNKALPVPAPKSVPESFPNAVCDVPVPLPTAYTSAADTNKGIVFPAPSEHWSAEAVAPLAPLSEVFNKPR